MENAGRRTRAHETCTPAESSARALINIPAVSTASREMHERTFRVVQVEVSRDGKVYHMAFERGKTTEKLSVIGRSQNKRPPAR